MHILIQQLLSVCLLHEPANQNPLFLKFEECPPLKVLVIVTLTVIVTVTEPLLKRQMSSPSPLNAVIPPSSRTILLVSSSILLNNRHLRFNSVISILLLIPNIHLLMLFLSVKFLEEFEWQLGCGRELRRSQWRMLILLTVLNYSQRYVC